MPNHNDSSNPTSASDDIALFLFQPILPTSAYTTRWPMLQICDEAADFMLPLFVGSALVSYFDHLSPPVLYGSDNFAEYHGFRINSQNQPHLSSSGAHRHTLSAIMPTDYMGVTTRINYRTFSKQSVALLMAKAQADGLDVILNQWVLTHAMALAHCGGFTLLAVQVIEGPSNDHEPDQKLNRNELSEAECHKQRRSFKRYLALLGSNADPTQRTGINPSESGPAGFTPCP